MQREIDAAERERARETIAKPTGPGQPRNQCGRTVKVTVKKGKVLESPEKTRPLDACQAKTAAHRLQEHFQPKENDTHS